MPSSVGLALLTGQFGVDFFNRMRYTWDMEKQKAHYPLSRVCALIQQGSYRVTRKALQCAAHDFGFVKCDQLAQSVLGLKVKDFYKSMTTLHDSTLWQDVYRPLVAGKPAYVKVQIVEDEAVVISFKSLEDE